MQSAIFLELRDQGSRKQPIQILNLLEFKLKCCLENSYYVDITIAI